MVVVANATDTRLDLFCVAERDARAHDEPLRVLLGVLQLTGALGGAWTALFGLITRVFWVTCSRSSCSLASVTALWAACSGGHGTGNRFDQLVLHMVKSGECAPPVGVPHRQQPEVYHWWLVTRQLSCAMVVQRGHSVSLIKGLSQLFQKNEVALGVHRVRQRPPVNVSSWAGGVLGARHWLCVGFIVVVGHHRLFHLDIDLLLSPIGAATSG